MGKGYKYDVKQYFPQKYIIQEHTGAEKKQ